LPTARYHDWIRRCALWGLVDGRRPGRDEHALQTPDWALAQIAEISGAAIAAISASRATIAGDLTNLIGPSAPSADAELATVPVDVAVELLLGLVKKAARQ